MVDTGDTPGENFAQPKGFDETSSRLSSEANSGPEISERPATISEQRAQEIVSLFHNTDNQQAFANFLKSASPPELQFALKQNEAHIKITQRNIEQKIAKVEATSKLAAV